MTEIIELQLKQYVRKIQNYFLRTSSFFLASIIFFIGLCSIHLYLLTTNSENNNFIHGWLIIGFFLANAFFGLISNRLPSKLHDFTWIYSVPKPMFLLFIALFIAQILPRLTIWLASALLVDCILLFASTSIEPGAFSYAVISFSIILIYELLAFTCSTVRGSFLSLLVFYVLLGLLISGYAVLSFFIYNGSINLSSFSIIAELGDLLNGALTTNSLIILSYIIIICLFIIFFFTRTTKFKEKLLFEADFWSQHEDFNSFVASFRGHSNYSSWWGGKFLDGKLSFIWFELLLLRKNYKSLIVQLVITSIMSYLILNYSIHFYYILFGFFIMSTILSGYMTSVVRHYHANTIKTTPGSMLSKVITIELTSMLPTLCTVIVLSLVPLIQTISMWTNILMINLLFALVLILRIFVFFNMIVADDVTGPSYFKKIISLTILCSMILLLIYNIQSHFIAIVIFLMIALFMGGIAIVNKRYNQKFKGARKDEGINFG